VIEQRSPIFYCNGQTISLAELPEEAVLCGCYSLYYAQTYIWAINFDVSKHWVSDGVGQAPAPAEATPPHDGNWKLLSFEHNDEDFSSVACYGGEHFQLRTQRPDQAWVTRLLPQFFHAPTESRTQDMRYGGLSGDLPLILGLIALTIHPDHVPWLFQNCFRDGDFVQTLHDQPSGCE
jgi:hypothetical protein